MLTNIRGFKGFIILLLSSAYSPEHAKCKWSALQPFLKFNRIINPFSKKVFSCASFEKYVLAQFAVRHEGISMFRPFFWPCKTPLKDRRLNCSKEKINRRLWHSRSEQENYLRVFLRNLYCTLQRYSSVSNLSLVCFHCLPSTHKLLSNCRDKTMINPRE